MTTKTKASPVPYLDLRPITRDTDRVLTHISICTGYERFEWIDGGQVRIDRNDSCELPYASVSMHLRDGATDEEHDSAYAIKFDVVDLRFHLLSNGFAHYSAIIKPKTRWDDANSFRVPEPGWDPFKGAVKCTQCKGKDAHKMVDYLPSRNEDVLTTLSGVGIKIITGYIREGE